MSGYIPAPAYYRRSFWLFGLGQVEKAFRSGVHVFFSRMSPDVFQELPNSTNLQRLARTSLEMSQRLSLSQRMFGTPQSCNPTSAASWGMLLSLVSWKPCSVAMLRLPLPPLLLLLILLLLASPASRYP